MSRLYLGGDDPDRVLSFHDLQQDFLHLIAEDLPGLHDRLLNAHGMTRWRDLPEDEPYLWHHLTYHLKEAGRLDELVETVKDIRYLARKATLYPPYATEADLQTAANLRPADDQLRALLHHFRNAEHVLVRCRSENETALQLYMRLGPISKLTGLAVPIAQALKPPYITATHPLPELPDSALLRTLSGHSGPVVGCALSADGGTVVSASWDSTLKVWDAATGEARRTLSGHSGGVWGCALSADGATIVSASDDNTLKVWDAATGEARRTLSGHSDSVNSCALSADGGTVVSASRDNTLKVWDAATGEARRTLSGHSGGVWGCALSADGATIVSASDDNTP